MSHRRINRKRYEEQRIRDLEAELGTSRRQHDGVQREWAHRGKRLREVANERDDWQERAERAEAKLDAVKAFIANRSVIGGMDRMRLAAILADTDEPKAGWVCSKCAREAVRGYDDGQIPEHHRTCPKRVTDTDERNER